MRDRDGVDASTGTTAQGLKSLYMGHSYFRRQAEAMQEYADVAGIEGHESTSIFGGYEAQPRDLGRGSLRIPKTPSKAISMPATLKCLA